MIELEKKAREDWERSVSTVVGTVHEPVTVEFAAGVVAGAVNVGVLPEYVAIGIVEEEDVVWWELPNTADPSVASSEGRGEFYVADWDLYAVLKAMASERGYLKLGEVESTAIDRMLRAETLVLWHSHVNTVEPSAEDIAEFPAWLADAGMVYHAPTQTTTLYNGAGIISHSGVPATHLATPQEG